MDGIKPAHSVFYGGNMIIKNVNIDSVKPYINNPRKNGNAVNAVAESIRKYGFQQPIVVNRDGIIIIGHTRFKAAHVLGMQEVPVTVADNLNDDEVAALRLVDNRTAEFSEWEMGKLSEELAELKSEEIDLEFDFGVSFGLKDEVEIEMTEDNGDEGCVEEKEIFDGTDYSNDVKTCRCPRCGYEMEE